MPSLLIQTAGSLVAILALGGLAWWMKLGGEPRFSSDEDVHRAVNEVEDGFRPVAISRAQNGMAALVMDPDGRVMVIKRHGNRFAGRVLGVGAQARLWHDMGNAVLEVDCGEARFGTATLDIADAEAWGNAINQLSGVGDA